MAEKTLGIVSVALEKLMQMVENGEKDAVFKALDYFAKIGVYNEVLSANFKLEDLENG